MSVDVAPAGPTTTEHLLSFWLDGELFGVEVAHIQEVLRSYRLTPVPLAPTGVAGLVNLRGQVVTAIDLREQLGRPAADEDVRSVAVVVRADGEVMSLLVDQVADVVGVRRSDFEPPPDTLQGPARTLIRGAYKLHRQLLLELDVDRAVRVRPREAPMA